MNVVGSIITVNTNSKILVRYDKDGLHLPKVEVGETMTIKGHLISTLLSLKTGIFCIIRTLREQKVQN